MNIEKQREKANELIERFFNELIESKTHDDLLHNKNKLFYMCFGFKRIEVLTDKEFEDIQDRIESAELKQ